ncbi:MAG: hypothetical protein HC767_01575, partial [Akkermansiaceae bacterium]|nr:hypothetical protein [Akkermansiaceae bacterium]
MKFTLQKLILISALLAGVLVWYFWTNKESIAHKKSINTAQQNSEMVSASRSPDRSEDVGSAAKSNGPPNASQRDVTQLIEEALSKFLASADAGESAAILQQLRDSIRKADAQSAAAAIIEFLKSGRDADTKLPFKVGSDGILEASPTLRTALLDLLPSLDPGAALDVAREVMDQKNRQ